MEVTCPILGHPTEVKPTRFSRGNWTIVQCMETGFVFLKDPPAYDQLESELSWEVTFETERQRRLESEPFVSYLSSTASKIKNRLFPRRNRFFTLARNFVADISKEAPLRILDVGCGNGHLLKQLHERFENEGRKVIPYGIEVSYQLAETATRYIAAFGGKIIQKNAIAGASALEPRSIDLVIMSSFLEHECQPLELLKRLHIVLADNGAIVLKVPNFGCVNRHIRGAKWCGFRYPDHVNYFTATSLLRLAKESGYICCQTIADVLPLSDNMYAVLKKVPQLDLPTSF